MLAGNPANIYLFKVNNRSTRKRCEICSKITVKTPERRLFLVFRLFTLSMYLFVGKFLNLERPCVSYGNQLVNFSDQLTGFHIMAILARNWLKTFNVLLKISLEIIFLNIWSVTAVFPSVESQGKIVISCGIFVRNDSFKWSQNTPKSFLT